MKKIFAIALVLLVVLSLTACGGKTDPVDNNKPDTSQQEPDNNNDQGTTQQNPSDNTVTDEVTNIDIGISAIPAEWQKGIGKSLFGMNTGSGNGYSDSYTNKFGQVSADSYAKLIAYFDTLSYTEKLDGVYNCEWGQLQIGHNPDASEMTISWYAN